MHDGLNVTQSSYDNNLPCLIAADSIHLSVFCFVAVLSLTCVQKSLAASLWVFHTK